jgi:ribonuclease J
MRVRIHRGAHEIGGNCVEVESSGFRLVLDVGRPLDVDSDTAVELPPVAGLATGNDPSLLGVAISHPHLDHWGLLPKVPPSVPVYIGESAARILREAAFFSPFGIDLHPRGFLCDRQPLTLGPFTVTPFLVDHSAYDAFALLVEAEGKRLFYSGDLRAHGRKGALVERLMAAPPPSIDVLLMEGTQVRQGASESGALPTEADVEKDLIETFRSTDGMALVSFSSQNIDRLVTIYRACLQAGRNLVVDLYTATIAKATGRSSIPQPGFDRLKVFVPHFQKLRMMRAEDYDRVNAIKPWRIFPEQLAAARARTVMLFRSSMIGDLEQAECLEGAKLVWSLWHGYLKDDSRSTTAMLDFCNRHGIPLVEHHTSGHAGVTDLRRFVDALKPGRVVPIHTEAPGKYPALFPHVELHGDGTWWEV